MNTWIKGLRHGLPREQLVLSLILLTYVVISSLYALLTPPWQVPDEPAHYNYIRQLAAGRLPIIEPGDYDHNYQEMLVSERFPPQYSLSGIQYEDHQPPLYYLLATPIFLLFDGALLPLRLFSSLLGAGVIVLTYLVGRRIYPGRPLVTLTAVALVAFIPQHIAMMAGVNNDSLAELLLAAALLGAATMLTAEDAAKPWLLGLVLGAVFWTKSTAYIAAPVLGAALLFRWRHRKEPIGSLARQLAVLFGPALLLGAATAGRFVRDTFRSFWGMFGWMSVAMDTRIYQGLGILTGVTGLGFCLGAVGQRRKESEQRAVGQFASRHVPTLLAVSAVLTIGGYLWWNLSFVQHQGRYLFPALIPLGLAAGVGWEKLTQARTARIAATALVPIAIVLTATGYRFAACWCIGVAGLLWLNSLLPIRIRWLLVTVVAGGLALLSGGSLFLFVIPWLS
jgi:4-amino-4-deoxy-L-arabinose transferase-like glycosyltransferase